MSDFDKLQKAAEKLDQHGTKLADVMFPVDGNGYIHAREKPAMTLIEWYKNHHPQLYNVECEGEIIAWVDDQALNNEVGMTISIELWRETRNTLEEAIKADFMRARPCIINIDGRTFETTVNISLTQVTLTEEIKEWMKYRREDNED
jgi:hypothetical protein